MNHVRALLLVVFPVLISGFSQADDSTKVSLRFYTPEQVMASHVVRGKGAVQFLWENLGRGVRYEIEINNGHNTFNSIVEKNYFHTMLFVGRDYRWRVKSLSAQSESEFSSWRPVRVRPQIVGVNTSMDVGQEESFELDPGGY